MVVWTTIRLLGGILFLVPAVAPAVGGGILLSKAPATWGVAAHVDIADWIITASCCLIAIPPLLLGIAYTVRIFLYLRSDFDLQWWHLPFGCAPLWSAYPLIALAGRIAEPSSYDSLGEASGTPTSGAAVFVFTAAVVLFAYAVLWMCLYFYSEAFSQPRRIPLPEPEIDRIGAILNAPAGERSG